MRKTHARRLFASAALLVAGMSQPSTASQDPPPGAPAAEVRTSTRHDASAELRRLPPIPPRMMPEVAKPPRRLPNRRPDRSLPGDGALQTAVPQPSLATIASNFEGVNNVNGVLPPDTTGDIGPNHYVQTVNLAFAVWNKAGVKLYGPADIHTLWQGFGGPCETTNDGDPVVLYDQLADRWMISQFALPRFPRGPFYQCIAVSQTGDPLGSYHRYEFKIHDSKLNDYPKFGVWGDGYYMSINQYSCNIISCSWGGQGAVVFERDRMLAGQTARMIYFDLHSTDANLGGMLPADLDGTTLPAAGTPNPFVLIDDDAWGYSPDQLQIWDFKADWTTPLNSTLTLRQKLTTPPFDSDMCGYSRNCIPQRDTAVKVDAMSDRLLYRLQFRNLGSRYAMVVNHTVDAGSDRAGIRWYELSNFGSNWMIGQTGTYAPADGLNRWMGSIAMNGAGHIALGYSVSSGSLFPSIRATGRLPADPDGQMSQGEVTLVNGAGHQTHSSGRWGDYSTMSVDPMDDCTFWYTQEYYGAKTSASWQTRVASFKLAECGGGGSTNTPPIVNIDSPASGETVSGASVAIQIAASDAEPGPLTVEWNVDGGTWQSAAFNSTSGLYEANWNTTIVTNGTHTLNARATDGGGLSSTASHSVTVNNVTQDTTMHVGDLDGSSTGQGNAWTATVVITVHDGAHGPVAGALVSGSWSNGATGSKTCTTDTAGACTVSVGGMPKKTASVQWTVTNITASGRSYAAGSNHDPDSDSSGTTIVVRKP